MAISLKVTEREITYIKGIAEAKKVNWSRFLERRNDKFTSGKPIIPAGQVADAEKKLANAKLILSAVRKVKDTGKLTLTEHEATYLKAIATERYKRWVECLAGEGRVVFGLLKMPPFTAQEKKDIITKRDNAKNIINLISKAGI